MFDKQNDEVEDIDVESTDESVELGGEEALKQKLKALRAKLSECEKAKQGFHEDLQRTRADFLNSKRRLTEQFSLDRERVVEDVLADFLPLLDSFDTALAHEVKETDPANSWREGIEVMHGQFMGLLKKYDIEEIRALNLPFNPHEHDAVSNRETSDATEKDIVLEVVQKGFKRNETIIRPARVVVGS